ncbi:CMP/dCMP deaminase zinc-binding protein [Helicostylum pulchrum]|uniref:CMP/dCMP-type deaminase domain-containing protein n=1 Tax=Helicostylum pulchrum TaxID=562976 RepID=A0ABP9Y5Z2_9FUNG|nr:CMP/dCMP deaminase zinc-binding protein [Helicostylum pulchrum]
MSLPTNDQMVAHLRQTIKVAARAKKFGRHPFGSILVDADHETVLLEQGNIDTLHHAESTLCHVAWTNFSPEYLAKCTLYTNFEPCVMCAGSCYWSGIGTVVYGISEDRLLDLTGNSQENPTMSMPCRNVFDAGQRKVNVFGPFPQLEQEIIADHLEFWT